MTDVEATEELLEKEFTDLGLTVTVTPIQIDGRIIRGAVVFRDDGDADRVDFSSKVTATLDGTRQIWAKDAVARLVRYWAARRIKEHKPGEQP